MRIHASGRCGVAPVWSELTYSAGLQCCLVRRGVRGDGSPADSVDVFLDCAYPPSRTIVVRRPARPVDHGCNQLMPMWAAGRAVQTTMGPMERRTGRCEQRRVPGALPTADASARRTCCRSMWASTTPANLDAQSGRALDDAYAPVRAILGSQSFRPSDDLL